MYTAISIKQTLSDAMHLSRKQISCRKLATNIFRVTFKPAVELYHYHKELRSCFPDAIYASDKDKTREWLILDFSAGLYGNH